MCGISGIFDLRGRRSIDPARLERMNATLRHRGPDDTGVHIEPGLALGHQRLSIVDLGGGAQPMGNENGRVITVFNGEIYNFTALRSDLERQGHTLRTRSDTEVIVHAWEDDGVRSVERLRGMFAYALWDAERELLFLARDRLGEKPLYYAVAPDGFLLFGSEVGAVVAGLGAVPDLDPEAVADYFTFGYVPDPKSIFAGIRKLPPAHYLAIARGEPEPVMPRRYWRLRFQEQHQGDDAELASALQEQFRDAVRMRMIADVPIGAFLSGGVDSSGVVALMAQTSATPIRTCSIGFDDREHDETSYAGRLAEMYGTVHSSQRVGVDVCALMDRIAAIYGEPFADASALPTFMVCAAARRQVKVALSGDGGDEVFAGYRRYAFYCCEERARAMMPSWVRRLVLPRLAHWYPKLDWAPRALRAKATLEALASDSIRGYLRSIAVLPPAEADQLFSRDFKTALNGYDPATVLDGYAAEAGTDDALNRAQFIDLHTWLPGRMLVKVDRASMACGLEVRPPLLDHCLVEWATGLPSQARLRGGRGKYLLKRALEPLVPAELLYRRKQGFAPPLARWLRHELADQVLALPERSAVAASGLFDQLVLRRMVSAHRNGTRDYSQILWAILMFDSFLRQSWSTQAASLRPMALAG